MSREPHTNSYYAASANPSPDRPSLQGVQECDVCVVGGGMTGNSAALHLAERGYKVILVEAQKIAWGASGRSGGQMIIGYNKSYGDLCQSLGKDDATKLWQMGEEALNLTRELIKKHEIQCDLADGHYHVALKNRQTRELEEMLEDYEAAGYSGCQLLGKDEIQQRIASKSYVSGLYDPHGGHLHPMNYTLGLAAAAEAAGATLYEHSPVTKIDHAPQPRVYTAQGEVRCRYIALCTNAYLNGVEEKLESKIMPVATYILATEPFSEEEAKALICDNGAVADINFVLNYYRFSGDRRLLFGGGASYSAADPANIGRCMQRTMLRYFPQLADKRIDYAWGGNVGITVNRLPHFGKAGPNSFFAQGFSGHGVLLTGLAGKLIAEAIAGQAERFDVFARIPHQRFFGGPLLRVPALVLAMAYFRLRDLM